MVVDVVKFELQSLNYIVVLFIRSFEEKKKVYTVALHALVIKITGY